MTTSSNLRLHDQLCFALYAAVSPILARLEETGLVVRDRDPMRMSVRGL